MKTEIEAGEDWITISSLENGATYDYRLVALNDGLTETRSETKQIVIGQQEGRQFIPNSFLFRLF